MNTQNKVRRERKEIFGISQIDPAPRAGDEAAAGLVERRDTSSKPKLLVSGSVLRGDQSCSPVKNWVPVEKEVVAKDDIFRTRCVYDHEIPREAGKRRKFKAPRNTVSNDL